MKDEIKIECPKHLLNTKTSNVFSIYKNECEYYAFLNNLDEGRIILIKERTYDEIKNYWGKEQSVNLLINSGTIRDIDNVIIPKNCTIEINNDE